jgi:RecB family endonuclease NucS
MTTHIEIISAMYYKCYESILLGKLEKCKLFYDMLQKEFEDADNKEVFQEFLTRERMDELNLIKKQVEANKLIEEFQPFEPMEHSIEMSKTEIELEKLVVKAVAKKPSLLEPFLSDNLRVYNIEHPCGPKLQDSCDMVMIDDEGTLYAIEFKLNKATHAVIGQVGKYCLHFKLRLSYNHFKRVHGVVIANSYSKYAINELKKRGYTCLAHSGDVDNLKITKL